MKTRWSLSLPLLALLAAGAHAEEAHLPVDLSGGLRYRATWFKNFGLYEKTRAGPDSSDLQHDLRADLAIAAKPAPGTGVLLAPRAVHRFGDNDPTRSRRAKSEFFLHQAYLDLLELGNYLGASQSLRIGRQEIVHGRELLVGRNDWSMEGRSFDALRWAAEGPDWDVDAFHAVVLDSAGDQKDARFSGLRARHTSLQHTLGDVFLYHLEAPGGQPLTIAGQKVDQRYWTLGGSLEGKLATRWTGFLMLATQRGRRVDRGVAAPRKQDVESYAGLASLDYFAGRPWLRNVGFEISLATGDKLASGDKFETFQPLFPSDHTHAGMMDWWGLMNADVYSAYLAFDLAGRGEGWFELHRFQLHSNGSAWYLGNREPAWWGASPVAGWPSNGVSSEDGGHEIDLRADLPAGKARRFGAGYALYLPGDLLQSATLWGKDNAVHWAYVETEVLF